MVSSSPLVALMARTLENPRKQHAFEAVEEIPEDDDDFYLDDDFSKNDGPYIDEDGHFLANEQIVSDIDDDLALDDEEYHEAPLGYREARELMKEARVARGFYPVVVPIRTDKLTGRGTVDPSSVKNVSGKTGRGKGGRGSKRYWKTFPTLVAAAERGKVEGAQERVIFHRVLESVSSVVGLITGRVIVQRRMMVLRESWSLRIWCVDLQQY